VAQEGRGRRTGAFRSDGWRRLGGWFHTGSVRASEVVASYIGISGPVDSETGGLGPGRVIHGDWEATVRLWDAEAPGEVPVVGGGRCHIGRWTSKVERDVLRRPISAWVSGVFDAVELAMPCSWMS
jgi:hypothetical protein